MYACLEWFVVVEHVRGREKVDNGVVEGELTSLPGDENFVVGERCKWGPLK